MKKSANETPDAKPAQPAPEKKWQRWMPWVITAFFALWLLGSLRSPADKSPFHLAEFGKLPVVSEGRVQPFDSVARHTLLLMRGKQTLALEPEATMSTMARLAATKRMPAIEWLLELMTRPTEADKRKVFRIDHPELKSLLKLPIEEKHFSLDQIRAAGPDLAKEAQRISKVESEVRSPFEKAVGKLTYALTVYSRFKSALQPEGAENFAGEIEMFESGLPSGLEAVKQNQAGEKYEEGSLALLVRAFQRFDDFREMGYPEGAASLLPLVVPPVDPQNKDGWSNIGATLKESIRSGVLPPAAKAYPKMATAFAKNQPEQFNAAAADYGAWLKGSFGPQLTHGAKESRFNHFAPFIKTLTVYLAAFLFACIYWLRWSPWLRETGFKLIALGLVVHTIALLFRMHLQGRPPVTNLYSSAIFVGWGAPVLGLILERIFRDGIGTVAASSVGFVSLVIAHNLSLDGTDTMKLLQAVLDTNIWLATHVVVITLGYASMFLAGILAIIYVVRGLLTPHLSAQTSKNLARMVYGIICFSTLFSFVGTVLGGIWADQSWGRFWGWDVKENGALIIVIWCALVLHARWGGLVKEQGLMALAIFGNVVTAWSWFGVNMLNVGLHSYGFMDEARLWLTIFVGSQLLFIIMAVIPQRFWRSAIAPSATPVKLAPAQ